MTSDTTLEDLERAVQATQKWADAHFANSMHAFGHVLSPLPALPDSNGLVKKGI